MVLQKSPSQNLNSKARSLLANLNRGHRRIGRWRPEKGRRWRGNGGEALGGWCALVGGRSLLRGGPTRPGHVSQRWPCSVSGGSGCGVGRRSDGDEEWRRSTRGPLRIGAWLRQGPRWPAVARPRTAVDMQRRRRTVQWARALGLVRLAAKESRGRAGASGSANRVQKRSSCSLREQ